MFNESIETNAMLKAILQTIDEGIHVVDSNGITIFYNEVAASHDGLTVNDVLGSHVLDVFPSLTKETSTLLKVIQTGIPIINQQQSYTNSKGKRIDTVNTTLPIKVDDELIGAIEIAKDYTQIKRLSEKLLDMQAMMAQKDGKSVKKENDAHFHLHDIITIHDDMEKLKKTAQKVSSTSSPILVYGETGTGKELLVQGIHNASPRRAKPFIAQNCAAIPSTLLEGILFGTTKGSFTGAVDRAGLFELANGGTLFLDELNSMPLDIQAKLLRVLQEGVVRRVGASTGKLIDVRVVAALNEEPECCIENKTLRQDLYYRLNVIYFEIPPLRDRKEDLPVLIDHFIKTYNIRFHKAIEGVDEEVLELFDSYHWPGNIRELKHAIEFAMNMAEKDGMIQMEHIPGHILRDNKGTKRKKSFSPIRPLREVLREKEDELISRALSETGGNIQQAAKLLKIPRQTLQYKIKSK